MKHFPILFLALFLLLFSSCVEPTKVKEITNETFIELKKPIDYVDTHIGTGGHGHTYPGVSMPFGMMQLSPDTRLEGWDGCGGYHYSDSIIYGFSHTHLSGTGISDYGDVLLMPVKGRRYLGNGADGNPGYRSRFSHDKEINEVGFYQVYLEDAQTEVSLTTNVRSGMHKYVFDHDDTKSLTIDLEHRDKLLFSQFVTMSKNTISGSRVSKEWAAEQHLYFYMEFSESLIELEAMKDGSEIYNVLFDTELDSVLIRIGISAVSIEGAKKNLRSEINHWDFEKVVINNKAAWTKELNKTKITKATSEENLTEFYTAAYHSYLNPNTYSDVDGNYRGMDKQIHKLERENDTQYTVFSLWDTYRATHPLFTLTQKKRTNEFIRTFLRQYKQGGELPIWELAANYTGCMIGYHSIPVITDAMMKGINDYDVNLALDAMVHSAHQDKLGLESYKRLGFVNSEEESESVSKTLEYAYDDWCIAQALKLNKDPREKEFHLRGQYYKNIYDPESHFMRAKTNNSWAPNFDPFEVNFHFTEANAWQYSLYAPQDVNTHIDMMGGPEAFEKHLDDLFSVESQTTGREQVDITGLIGQYAHGNEPSHHFAYLYNYVGKPYKTQQKIHEIVNTLYTDQPDGLSGNEDCGQMSSWYVLSSLGFYPIAPGSNEYIIGTPGFSEIELELDPGKKVSVKANNLTAENFYIQSMSLDGKDFTKSFITHEELSNAKEIVFEMGSKPSNWATAENDLPKRRIEGEQLVALPFFVSEGNVFEEDLSISIQSPQKGEIYYRLQGEEQSAERKFEEDLVIENSMELIARVKLNDKWSKEVSAKFFKIAGGRSIVLESEYANQYAAGGDNALIDYQRGGNNYRTGKWQGYREDFHATIDLGKRQKVNVIGAGFLQDVKSWIFYPSEVEISVSVDGKKFNTLGVQKTSFPETTYGSFINDYEFKVGQEIQFIKVRAKNYGICPDWHLGAGGTTWIFTDEIWVK